ncbi:MAG: hypothetical protein H0U71_07465 [Gammaproteobacteria bacterium]|nr:hypothetical protein [Gammaproteobacteria bacterium]
MQLPSEANGRSQTDNVDRQINSHADDPNNNNAIISQSKQSKDVFKKAIEQFLMQHPLNAVLTRGIFYQLANIHKAEYLRNRAKNSNHLILIDRFYSFASFLGSVKAQYEYDDFCQSLPGERGVSVLKEAHRRRISHNGNFGLDKIDVENKSLLQNIFHNIFDTYLVNWLPDLYDQELHYIKFIALLTNKFSHEFSIGGTLEKNFQEAEQEIIKIITTLDKGKINNDGFTASTASLQREEIHSLKRKINELESKVIQKTAAETTVKMQVRTLNDKYQAERLRSERLVDENTQLIDQNRATSADVERLVTTNEYLSHQLHEMENSKTLSDEAYTNLIEELKDHIVNLDRLMAKVAKNEAHTQKLEKASMKTRSKIAKDERTILSYSAQISDLENRLDHEMRSVTNLEAENGSLKSIIEDYQEKIIKIESESKDLRKQLRDTAKGFYREGLQHVREKNFHKSAEAFEQSYRTSFSNVTFFKCAQAYYLANKFEPAQTIIEDILSDEGNPLRENAMSLANLIQQKS